MTTIQDRAKLIATSVEDMATRQIQEAVLADPVSVHMRAFLTQAVDGVYLEHPRGEEPMLIPREEYGGVQTEELFKLVADKRAAMLGEAQDQAEAEEG